MIRTFMEIIAAIAIACLFLHMLCHLGISSQLKFQKGELQKKCQDREKLQDFLKIIWRYCKGFSIVLLTLPLPTWTQWNMIQPDCTHFNSFHIHYIYFQLFNSILQFIFISCMVQDDQIQMARWHCRWPRSAVMLAIFTVLPFGYVVPMCLPRLELETGMKTDPIRMFFRVCSCFLNFYGRLMLGFYAKKTITHTSCSSKILMFMFEWQAL